MYAGPSNFIESVDGTFLFVMIVSVFFLVLITALMVFFVFKYSRKRNPKAVNVHSNLALEITWTVIPTILVLIMFWYGWVGYMEMANAPENSLNIDVTAQMWKWSFKYENGTTTDTLYVPVDRPVKLNLNSLDVNHALFIPAFRVKKDILPGQDRFVWFESNEVGAYDIACAEYCGLNHSYMYSKVIVMTENDFNVWSDTAGKSTLTDTVAVLK